MPFKTSMTSMFSKAVSRLTVSLELYVLPGPHILILKLTIRFGEMVQSIKVLAMQA